MRDRAELAARLIRPGSVVAELGVARGHYSDLILSVSQCRTLYSIDRWAGDRGHDADQEAAARALLARHGGRSVVICEPFAYARALFADGSLDLVYVDGYAHEGQDGGRTMDDWVTAVRPGGIIAGHDYCYDSWPLTVEAVDAFADRHGLVVQVTAAAADGGDEYPSWWAVLPPAGPAL